MFTRSAHPHAKQPNRSAIHAVVTRADGTVEDLGVIAFRSRNPLLQLRYNLLRALGRHVSEASVLKQPKGGTNGNGQDQRG